MASIIALVLADSEDVGDRVVSEEVVGEEKSMLKTIAGRYLACDPGPARGRKITVRKRLAANEVWYNKQLLRKAKASYKRWSKLIGKHAYAHFRIGKQLIGLIGQGHVALTTW